MAVLAILLFHLFIHTNKFGEDGHGTGAPPLPSGGIGPTRAATATRRAKGQTRRMGAYSLVCLFFLLPTLLFFSLFFFPVLSFAAEHNDELGGTGHPPSLARDRGDTGGDSDAEDERADAPDEYVLLSVCSSYSLLSSSSCPSSFRLSLSQRSTMMS